MKMDVAGLSVSPALRLPLLPMDLITTGLKLRTGRWKALLIGFFLFSFTVMGIECTAAVATFMRGTEGRLGLQGDAVMHDGRRATLVRGFEPWSQAPQAGVRVGDVLQPERWLGQGRAYLPGEVVAMTLVRDGSALSARITTVGRPIRSAERVNFVLNATLCVLGTLLGLLIGLRQAHIKTSRALALAFLWWSLNLGMNYTTDATLAALLSVVFWLALAPGWYFGLWFAVHYPNEQALGWRRALRRVLPLFLVALVLVEAAAIGLGLWLVPASWIDWVHVPYIGAVGTLMLVAFWDGRRRSSGELRQRFNWLLGAFALLWSVSYATYLGDHLGAAMQPLLSPLAVIGSLASLFGLSYAILRHRVLDMGLALNRSLVFTLVGGVLLGSFQFLSLLIGRLLHFDDPAKAGLLNAVLAALVALAYPRLKPLAEWTVDRVFFGPWVAREADLARFAADARGHTELPALDKALLAAIDRFTAGAGAALYVRQADGGWRRQQALAIDAPETLAADEPLAVALRAGHAVARHDEVHSTLPGELALVLSRQRDLEAFVLIGRPRDGRALRADEVAALRDALRTVGLEWQALRWEALQRRLAHAPAAGT